MVPKKPNLPPEAIELYNVYIHGGMTRRDFLDGAKRFAIGGLTLAAVVEALMPILGWLLGARIGPLVQAWDHWIAFVLLAFAGGEHLVVEALLCLQFGQVVGQLRAAQVARPGQGLDAGITILQLQLVEGAIPLHL